MVAQVDVAMGGTSTLPMPQLAEDPRGDSVYCTGTFTNLEILASGVAFLSYADVYGYGEACEGQVEPDRRITYQWEHLGDGAIGLYYDHSPGGAGSNGETGIPTLELVVSCTVEDGRLRCVDPEFGRAGGGSDFARPRCGDPSDPPCGSNERCFAAQCVVPAPP